MKNRMMDREELATATRQLKKLREELKDITTRQFLTLHEKEKKLPWEYEQKIKQYKTALIDLDKQVRSTTRSVEILDKQITEGVPQKK